eukprot:1158426-Pelagomonas_calceolata.AAC.1
MPGVRRGTSAARLSSKRGRDIWRCLYSTCHSCAFFYKADERWPGRMAWPTEVMNSVKKDGHPIKSKYSMGGGNRLICDARTFCGMLASEEPCQ